MYGIGIDIGSTYTKYCMFDGVAPIRFFSEKTPVRQPEYFREKLSALQKDYPDPRIVSCGYGKRNITANKNINELTALARGAHFMCPSAGMVLDIGGQDTKLIRQEKGELKEFFINDKCAAGSGLFLSGILNLLGVNFSDVDLTDKEEPSIRLSAVCAVFAQSEIVKHLSENVPPEEIVAAVVWQILKKAEVLLDKMQDGDLLLSGGLTQIKGFGEFARAALKRKCVMTPYSCYLSAIGCALTSLGQSD